MAANCTLRRDARIDSCVVWRFALGDTVLSVTDEPHDFNDVIRKQNIGSAVKKVHFEIQS